MTVMEFIYTNSPRQDEDCIQTAWVKALETTDHRPQARTLEELKKNYQHIAGLVVRCYRNERVDQSRKKETVALTEDIPVEYTMLSRIDECTPVEKEAIAYYLELIQQQEPLRAGQRAKLARLRKKSGLALDLNY